MAIAIYSDEHLTIFFDHQHDEGIAVKGNRVIGRVMDLNTSPDVSPLHFKKTPMAGHEFACNMDINTDIAHFIQACNDPFIVGLGVDNPKAMDSKFLSKIFDNVEIIDELSGRYGCDMMQITYISNARENIVKALREYQQAIANTECVDIKDIISSTHDRGKPPAHGNI